MTIVADENTQCLIATFGHEKMVERGSIIYDLFLFTIGVNHEQFANYRDLQLTPKLLRVRANSDN
jgi:pantothenate synthetase